MPRPLTFRPIGKASYFGDRGTEFAEFLKHEYGDLPVTLSVEDIPKLESWVSSKGGTFKGTLGILIHEIRKFKMIQVGYFDV